MAISLAIMIREAVIEIARLKLTDSDRDERSQELFDYVVGDKFVTRFDEVARIATSRGLDLKAMTPSEIDALWNEAKAAMRAAAREGL